MKSFRKGVLCSAVTAVFLLMFAFSANAQSKSLKVFEYPLESGCINTFLAPDRTTVRVDASQEPNDKKPTGCYPVVAKKAAPPAPAPTVVKTETKEIFPIYFDFDKSTIRTSEIPVLDKAAAFAKDSSAKKALVKIVSQGNACSCGDAAYNHNLALKRAVAVKSELNKRGIASEISVVSFGETKAGKNHKQDKRVDVVVTFNK